MLRLTDVFKSWNPFFTFFKKKIWVIKSGPFLFLPWDLFLNCSIYFQKIHSSVVGPERLLERYFLKSYSSFFGPPCWPGEGSGTPLQYSCLEIPMNGGACWAAVHGVPKSWAPLNDFTFTFHFHALQKEMATHSSVLAWRMPETEELSGLPSMGSHRAGHNWVT